MKNLNAFLLCALLALLSCTPSSKSHETAMAGLNPSEQNTESEAGDQTAGPVGFYDNSSDDDALLMCQTPKGTSSKILRRKGYICSYNSQTRIPNWVAWKLTKAHTYGRGKRSSVEFHEDMDVPAPRVTTFDYSRSGYDRGHLCPAGDNKWNMQALSETFLMTNVCPQNHDLNKGDWNDLEIQCRSWARKYGEIYVVCGPIQSKGKRKTIGKAKVTVPESFFKVVLCLKGEPRAVAFIYKNAGGHHAMSSYVRSIDEVERITGIKFFKGVDKRNMKQLKFRD